MSRQYKRIVQAAVAEVVESVYRAKALAWNQATDYARDLDLLDGPSWYRMRRANPYKEHL